MLASLDDVRWDQLEHAYGSAEDVPGMLRAAASDDVSTAYNGMEGLYASVVHQGSVYSATPVVLPFLLEIVADQRTHHRGNLLGVVATAAECDYDGSNHAALGEHVEQLIELLADEDWEVREMAAFTLGWIDGVPIGRLRWQHETHPQVRASILVSAARLDLGRAASWLPAALAEHGPVQAAAAYVIATRKLPWSQAATQAVVTSHAGGNPLEDWAWDHRWLATLVSSADDAAARDVVAALARSDTKQVRREIVSAAGHAMRARRSLPPLLVPLLGPLLADPDEDTRRDAAWQIAGSGHAALVADQLAALAASPKGPVIPGTADPRAGAVCALIELGDPRWRAPVLDGRPLDRIVDCLIGAGVPLDEELLLAVQIRLVSDPSDQEQAGLTKLLQQHA